MNRAPTSDLHADKKKILLGGISFILSSPTLATQYNPEKHHRRTIRLKGYDYNQSGMYFVTICTRNRECLFGLLTYDEVRLNDSGHLASVAWKDCLLGFRRCPWIPSLLCLTIFTASLL